MVHEKEEEPKPEPEQNKPQILPNDREKLLATKKQKFKRTLMKLFVVLLGILIVAGVLTSTLYVTLYREKYDNLGALSFDVAVGKLLVKNMGKDKAFEGYLGKGIVGGKIYKSRITADELYYEWVNTANLRVERDSTFDKCYVVSWSPGKSGVKSFQDCYNLQGLHIYGGSELYVQTWPLDTAKIAMQAFIPKDTILGNDQGKNVYGPVLERYWLNSNGVAVIVDESVPLHVGMNEKPKTPFCVKADLKEYENAKLHLTYKICIDSSIKTLHQYVMGNIFDLPTSTPDERMIAEPIWSTWAMYGKAVSQKDVLDYAWKIRKYNFLYSQIEIDDKYSSAYGDLNFDLTKFPNATEMIDSLHSSAFRVTVWVYPFANTDSEAFQEEMNYLVRGLDPQVPALVKWWNGVGGVLDTTFPNATRLFIDRLKVFQSKYNIDSFKFDAGEITYLPKGYKLYNMTNNNPSSFSSNYAILASQFGALAEVRVGHRTQKLPIFVRMLDRSSRWGKENGLKSVIPATLTLGILGYPFVLPDMVGGNGYSISSSVNHTQKPDKELYIRWMQMNTFLPAIQFSFAPWLYDNQTVAIAKTLMNLRAKIAPVLIQAAKDIPIFNAPIIRPLWWIAPNDETSLIIDSEFLVGNVYLVAPVLDSLVNNKGNHVVYLPPGKVWKKEFGSQDIIDASSGGKWMTFKVTLEDLPYFSIVKYT